MPFFKFGYINIFKIYNLVFWLLLPVDFEKLNYNSLQVLVINIKFLKLNYKILKNKLPYNYTQTWNFFYKLPYYIRKAF